MKYITMGNVAINAGTAVLLVNGLPYNQIAALQLDIVTHHSVEYFIADRKVFT